MEFFEKVKSDQSSSQFLGLENLLWSVGIFQDVFDNI